MGKKIIRCLFFGLMLAVFVLVFTDSTAWTKENVITTGPIDSLAFQELVDLAAPQTTIKCLGGEYLCYQVDTVTEELIPFPIRINKPLRIVALDENDPPIFRGTGNLLHSPLESGNNCFVVYNLIPDLNGLEFIGLHFRDFYRTLVFSPGHDPEDPAVPIEAGILSNLKVARCDFSDCFRGIQVWGKQTRKFEICDNTMRNLDIGIIVWGAATGFVGGIYNPGRPEKGTIVGNIVYSNYSGIVVNGCEDVSVRDNFVDSYSYGIWFGDEVAFDFPDDGPIRIGSAIGNEIQNAYYGICCFGPTTLHKSLVQDNSISNSWFGIVLDEGANLFSVVNNEFYNSLYYDIWLGGEYDPVAYPPESYDNTVMATDFVTTVVDNGTNNRLVGTLAMIHNPGIPDDVRQELEELRHKLAERMQL